MHRADLHIHTTASDGVYTPSKVVLRAKEKGVNFLAIAGYLLSNQLPAHTGEQCLTLRVRIKLFAAIY